jgi:membrane protease YdiL (CAAX protease family)
MTANTASTTLSRPANPGPTTGPLATPQPRQLTKRGIAGVWAAAALPMALMMWVVGPIVAHHLHGPQALTRAVVVGLTAALVWQFVLVMVLVRREQGTLRWSTVREVLWLGPPRSPRTGRVGGRVWLVVIPLVLGVGLEQFIPQLPHPAGRDLGVIMRSADFQHFMHGSWLWFAVLVTMFVFNTVFGEELLFRGYLLPRMNGVFGERDWIANGLIFAAYHLHRFWGIPGILLDMLFVVYPTKRFRSAWIGIAVHSAQTVIFTVVALTLVLR